MANMVSTSDFEKGEVKIPNAVSQNAGEGSNGDLQYLIDKYEKEMVLALLGPDQYTVLQGHLADIDNAPEPWKTLVQGDGLLWGGLKSMATKYVYCKWLVFDDVKVTSAGKGKIKAKNLTPVSPEVKFVDRWNELVRDSWKLSEYILDNDGIEKGENFPCWEFKNSLGL